MMKKQINKTEILLFAIIILSIATAILSYKLNDEMSDVKDELDIVSEHKDSILVLENKILQYSIIADSLTKIKSKEKIKQNKIIIKYVPVYEKIISTPDSLQYIITTDLLSKHRSVKFKK